MKLTKEQWKQLSDRIFLTLRPTQHPVAMKFIKTPEEFDAIPGIEFCQNKASVCKLIGMAAHFQGAFGLTPDHFSGYYCAMNNGCMPVNQEFLDGAILYKQPTPWHHNQEDAKKHIQSNLEMLPEKPFAGIVCASLCNCPIEEPEVISLQLPTQAAFHLLACYVETDWQKLEFPFSGESNCADTWMRTLKEDKVGLSIGCRGDRATGALGYGEVRVTMTTEQLLKALDGCDTVEKNNILYPYNPTCLYMTAIMAAVMSTAETHLFASGTSLVQDLAVRCIGVKIEEKKCLLYMRLVIFATTLLTVILALGQVDMIAKIGSQAFGALCAGFGPTLCLGLRWKRVNAKAATAGMIVGLIFGGILPVVDPGNVLLGQWTPAGVGVVLSTAVIIVVSLITKPEHSAVFDFAASK